MKKDNMISIRISDDDKHNIALIKRYDAEFNISTFFRNHLAKKMEEMKEKLGASVGFFEIAPEKKDVKCEEPKTEESK